MKTKSCKKCSPLGKRCDCPTESESEKAALGPSDATTSFLGCIDKALDALKTISVADWKTAGELRKMARDAYSSANADLRSTSRMEGGTQ